MRRGPVGPAESAAASTKDFIERKHFSRNVNYGALEGLFKTKGEDDDDSRAGTPLHDMDDKTDGQGQDDLLDGGKYSARNSLSGV
jgi:hypothetical protein